MYRSCIHCSATLGSNQEVESFPVGKRLAFDAARGRLWAICPSCGRWNLTPLEERWEAIEQCERLFGATRLRASTDQVGLARLRDGTDLVRIGEPRRPEFAAWRYGRVFASRRRRWMFVAGGLGAAWVAVSAGALWGLGSGILMFSDLPTLGFKWVRDRRVIDRVPLAHGTGLVRNKDADQAMLGKGEDGGPAIELPHSGGRGWFEGERARQLLLRVLPAINHRGARDEEVREAVGRIERAGSAGDYVSRLSADPGAGRRRFTGTPDHRLLASMPQSTVLALEMAMHEEQERAALEGELQVLHDAWREAEEIAAIADNLLLPGWISDRLRGSGAREAVERDLRPDEKPHLE